MRKSTLIGMIVFAGIGSVVAAHLFYTFYIIYMTVALNNMIAGLSPPCGGATIKFFCRDIIYQTLAFGAEGVKYGALIGALIGEIVGVMGQKRG